MHLRHPQRPASHQGRPVSAKAQAVRAWVGPISQGTVPGTRPSSAALVPTLRQQRALLQERWGSARIRARRALVERTSVAIVLATTRSSAVPRRRRRRQVGAAVVR